MAHLKQLDKKTPTFFKLEIYHVWVQNNHLLPDGMELSNKDIDSISSASLDCFGGLFDIFRKPFCLFLPLILKSKFRNWKKDTSTCLLIAVNQVQMCSNSSFNNIEDCGFECFSTSKQLLWDIGKWVTLVANIQAIKIKQHFP